jgi:hypothetical protein
MFFDDLKTSPTKHSLGNHSHSTTCLKKTLCPSVSGRKKPCLWGKKKSIRDCPGALPLLLEGVADRWHSLARCVGTWDSKRLRLLDVGHHESSPPEKPERQNRGVGALLRTPGLFDSIRRKTLEYLRHALEIPRRQPCLTKTRNPSYPVLNAKCGTSCLGDQSPNPWDFGRHDEGVPCCIRENKQQSLGYKAARRRLPKWVESQIRNLSHCAGLDLYPR